MSLICDDILSGITPEQITAYVEGLVTDGDFTIGDARDLINYVVSNGDTAGTSRDLIQVRRGNEVDLPELLQGELGYCLDTRRLFVGNVEGNDLINTNITLKSFGAKGDGSDETVTIQNAINYCITNNMTLVIDDGVYSTNDLYINNAVEFSIISHGWLKSINGATLITVNNSNRLDLNLKLDGNFVSKGINVVDSFGIKLYDGVIKNCTTGYTYTDNGDLTANYPNYYRYGSYIMGNRINDCGIGIYTNKGQYIKITNNTIGNNNQGIVGAFGNVEITDNTISGNVDGVVCNATLSINSAHSLLSGNTINHCDRFGVRLISQGSTMTLVNNCIIATNGPTTHTDGKSYSLYFENCSKVILIGNQIGGTAGTESNQVYLTKSHDINFIGNLFYDNVVTDTTVGNESYNIISLANNYLSNSIFTGFSQNVFRGLDYSRDTWLDSAEEYNTKTPTLLNSWTNTGGSFETAQYYKDGSNTVYLAGVVKGGALVSDVMVLPVGYRPSKLHVVFTGNVNGVSSVMHIYPTGEVRIVSGSTTDVILNASFKRNSINI